MRLSALISLFETTEERGVTSFVIMVLAVVLQRKAVRKEVLLASSGDQKQELRFAILNISAVSFLYQKSVALR
jgi:hypothetical protein